MKNIRICKLSVIILIQFLIQQLYNNFSIIQCEIKVRFHFSAGYPNAGSALNISTHVINAVYVILNVSVTGMPIRLLHFWHPVIYGIIYSFFSLFYHLGNGLNHHGNPYIYKPINWNNAGQAVGYCLAITFVGIPVVHFVLFGVHFVKVYISRSSRLWRCCVKTSPEWGSHEMERGETFTSEESEAEPKLYT